MKIYLTKTWSIERTRSAYVLKHVKLTNGTGKNIGPMRMIEARVGTYGDLDTALNKFWEKYLLEGTNDFEGSLEEYITIIRNLINSAIKETRGMVKAWEQDI